MKMKEKITKEYLRRMRKLLETILCSRNLIKGINTWAVTLVRYSGLFVKWTMEELRQKDETVDNSAGRSVKKKKKKKKRTQPYWRLRRCINTRLEDNIQNSKERLIKATSYVIGNIKTNMTGRERWYMHKTESARENETIKILSNSEIQTDYLILT